MGREIWLKELGLFFLYLTVQVLFFRNLAFFDGMVMVFPYVAFLILLPFGAMNMSILLVAFFMGFVVDIFYDSIGIHTAACVLLAFVRTQLMKWTAPTGGYELSETPTIGQMGLGTFLIFIAPQIILHHILLFMIEAGSWAFMPRAILRALLSSVATLLIILAIQYLFYGSSQRRRI
ncbi:rod shape-determining protein MreD [Flammeovirga kamogawensis]|uniref:Rod shape-determining protein MreD n=1 Tax=Flammeovirga kamogawensis TaxID=373891 RepID=A0ABX8GS89_9BACT|nr:rod shape-determining protein MreD [Flammeovirga kamogawensis]MBB6462906.1 putative neutral ceramidase superfamily lipid hydrolase [Flammeovirga kamogawensis]QWG06435.1 rod shape-determining protein MreD [Flammeovirga kamogawensis]TRX68266.1 rod shape-determining protein MreD [Flammeovirga kamogawensis]